MGKLDSVLFLHFKTTPLYLYHSANSLCGVVSPTSVWCQTVLKPFVSFQYFAYAMENELYAILK